MSVPFLILQQPLMSSGFKLLSSLAGRPGLSGGSVCHDVYCQHSSGLQPAAITMPHRAERSHDCVVPHTQCD